MRTAFIVFISVLLPAVILARSAKAQGACDDLVRQLIAGVLDGEHKSKNYDSALEKLKNAASMCGDGEYSKQVRAELQMAIGTVYGAMGSKVDAQRSFLGALKDDPDIGLNSAYTNNVADEAFRIASKAATAHGLTVRFATKVSGYTDTTGIHVLSPSVAVGMEHAQGGWGAGALLLMDVARASDSTILLPGMSSDSALTFPRRSEERFASAINGHKKLGAWDLALAGALWWEPQYLSFAAGINASLNLMQKTVIPRFGYQYSRDFLDAFPSFLYYQGVDRVDRHTISTGLGLVLSKATLGTGLLTMVFEEGSRPDHFNDYNGHSPTTGPVYPDGAVNVSAEHLPLDRARFGLTASVAHRFANATLRVNERGYYDSWGMLATTTDGRFIYDVTRAFRLWPHLRVHYQANISSYQLQPLITSSEVANIVGSNINTSAPVIARMLGVTVGGGARYGFGKRREYGLMFNADFISTVFFNYLFERRRFGFFGTIAFEAEFE